MADEVNRWDPLDASVFGCSRQGASHIAGGTPCQDAWRTMNVADTNVHGLVMAAADGHGASVHDLSEMGAQCAVRAACEVLGDFVQSFEERKSSVDIQNTFRADIPQRIVDRWRKLVLKDARQRIGEEEVANTDLNRVYFRYGTTLLAGLVTAEEVFLTSIGDGDILLVRPDGNIAVHMDQDAPGLTGPMTFSLASNDPEILFQTKIIDREDGGMLSLSTDGLIKSFRNEDYFWEFSIAIQERIRADGFADATSSLPDILDYVSLHGSGDDMTFVGAWIENKPLPNEELLETHHSISLRDEEALEMEGMGKTQYGKKKGSSSS